MRILITGGTGLLGKALVETLQAGHEVFATFLGDYEIENTEQVKYEKLDIRDEGGCERLFKKFKPQVVIHAAGVGSPDYAEKHKEVSWSINVDGTRNIINRCEKFGSSLVHISSNGIYDGDRAPYRENDEARPINYYGYLKLEGERIAKGSKVPHAVVRPILMYGSNYPFERPNIMTAILPKLRAGEKMFVYDDVYVTPLFVKSCAEAIWNIIEKGQYEDFNIGGNDRLNIYEFIRQAAEFFSLDTKLVVPVQQGFFNELVKRPKDTSYNTEKMQRVLGLKPMSVAEGLSLTKNL